MGSISSFTDQLTDYEKSHYSVINEHNLYQISSPLDISWTKKIIECDVKISVGHNVHFEDCYFKGNLHIENLHARSITMFRCFIDGHFDIIGDTAITGVFQIQQLQAHTIRLLQPQLAYSVWQKIICDNLMIHGGTFKTFLLGGQQADGCEINLLYMDCTTLSGSLEVSNGLAFIRSISITGQLQNASVTIRDVRLFGLDIFNFRNDGVLRLSTLEPSGKRTGDQQENSIIHIASAYLGRTEFYDINLSRFTKVCMSESSLVDVVLVDVITPNEILPVSVSGDYNNSVGSLTARAKYLLEDLGNRTLIWTPGNDFERQQLSGMYRNQREIYRQLKYAFGKQGNNIAEQHFHATEMRTYQKSLTGWQTWGTRFIIWTSYRFSNFGQKISWPLFSLLIGHLILLSIAIACGSINRLSISVEKSSWGGLSNSIHEYFRLINPIHNIDGNFAGWRIVLDVLMRIWSSYMIYNVIRASRRFIK